VTALESSNGWSSQKALFQPLIRAADPGWSSQKALFQPVIRTEDLGCQSWKLLLLLPSLSPLPPHNIAWLHCQSFATFCSNVISDFKGMNCGSEESLITFCSRSISDCTGNARQWLQI